MAHKTLVNGTSYDITGGKTLVSGTAYSIKGGKTLVGGTGYDISFAPPELIVYQSYGGNYGASVLEGVIRFRVFRQATNGNESWSDTNANAINKIDRLPFDAISNAIIMKASYNALMGKYFPVAWIGPIDLTRYSELHIDARREDVNRYSIIHVGCSSDTNDNLAFQEEMSIFSSSLSTTSSETNTLNISDVTGEMYIKIDVWTTGNSSGEEIYITKIWLT